ncbi:GNAT family N-acetyltransferase [Actinomadura kijaniata]|uniref:GNAT family N-acetyltransferase n=1 Tax=Actinomadura kijaniata TaxID=46161 RepID=UPI003F1B3770
MSDVQIRPLHPADAPAVAAIARRCLLEVNARDYPPEIVDALCAHNTAERFLEAADRRRIFVASLAGSEGVRVVGTVSLEGNEVSSLFVDPEVHGRGVGRLLMEHAEREVAAGGHVRVELNASVTARRFYAGLGYVDLGVWDAGFGVVHVMRKPLG